MHSRLFFNPKRNSMISCVLQGNLTATWAPYFSRRLFAAQAYDKYVLIAEKTSLLADRETQLFHDYLSKLPDRVGKMTTVNEHNAILLLNTFELNERYHKIHVTIIGHYLRDLSLAQFSTDDICQMIVRYPKVSHVTLLGCQTADSLVLNNELNMLHKLRGTLKRANEPAGLVLLNHLPSEKGYPDLLQRTRLPCAYVLVKRREEDKDHWVFDLIELQSDKNNSIKATHWSLQVADVKLIADALNPARSLRFPKQPHEKYILRLHTKPLTYNERIAILQASGVIKGFGSHYIESKDNNDYPFLSHVMMDANERDKLAQTSLFGNVIDKLWHASSLTQAVTIQGYPSNIFIDTDQQRTYATSQCLYPMFFCPVDNKFYRAPDINPVLLRKEQREQLDVAHHKPFQPEDRTTCKSISYTVRK